MNSIDLAHLSDRELVADIRRVAAAERRSTADLIALLVEVERRGVHLSLGFSSLFTFCTQSLGLSEQAAYSRITAARAVRRFPAIHARLVSGELTLSSLGLLAPHLMPENHEAVLAAAVGKSTREVERLIAGIHPQPDIPASVRALPVRQSCRPRPASFPSLLEEPADAGPTKPARPVIAPIAPARYFLKVTIGQQTHDKLTRLQALMRHSIPNGDPATIIDRALTLLLAETERTKAARVLRPRASGTTSEHRGRHIPASIKREVWTRDGGRGMFEGSEGRCLETAFLEFHHVVPFAAGGPTDASNLQLRCRAHNAHEARLVFGGELFAGAVR